MPADTNPYGDIFGGWLMSIMDSAAGTVASRYSRGRAVTIAVDSMTFHRPVKIGDVVSVYANVIEVGRTSMKIDVAMYAEDLLSGARELCTRGTFTMIALDADHKPTPVQPLHPGG